MKQRLALFAVLVVALTSLHAEARLGVGGLLSLNYDRVDSKDASYSYQHGYGQRMGVLGWVPIFPLLSLRSGLIYRHREIKLSGHLSSGTPFVAKYQDDLLEIPLNIQVDIPVEGLYAFGGATYSRTQASACRVTSGLVCPPVAKSPDDLLLNVGVGYTIWGFALMGLSTELEYAHGTRSISGTSERLYQRSLMLNLVADFSL